MLEHRQIYTFTSSEIHIKGRIYDLFFLFDPFIVFWDLRNSTEVLFILQSVNDNQLRSLLLVAMQYCCKKLASEHLN